MPKLIFAMILAIPSLVCADIIKCTFTEPFVNTTYSMAQQSLTIQSIEGPTQVMRNISFQILGPGRFELWTLNRTVVQRLDLNHEGSDGMSDRVYPYAARYPASGYGLLHGGCTSNFLHASE